MKRMIKGKIACLLVSIIVGMAGTVSAFQFREADYVGNQTEVTTPALAWAKIVWADYSQDGRTDYAVTGMAADGRYVTRLYCNVITGNGRINFTNVQELAEGNVAALAWGDYNNDGWPDLAVSGPGGLVLYQNNPDSNNLSGRVLAPLVDGSHLHGVPASCLAWYDYNNDGSLDLVCSGTDTNGNSIANIYRNYNHGEWFQRDVLASDSLWPNFSRVEPGDYDRDGWVDLLLTAVDYAPPYPGAKVKLYHNEPSVEGNLNRIYRQATNFPWMPFSMISLPATVWADFNNDGLLDVYMTGFRTDTRIPGSLLCYGVSNAPGGWGWSIGFLDHPLSYASVAVGDVDHDGRTDLLTVGQNEAHEMEFNVFTNQGAAVVRDPNGSNYVPRDNGAALPIQPFGTIALAHSGISGTAGGLDLLMVGIDTNGLQAGVMLVNTSPSPYKVEAPSLGISMTPGGDLHFVWDTPYNPHANTRTFDLAVGSSNHGVDVLSPGCQLGNWTLRTIPGRGNMGASRDWTLEGRPFQPGEFVYAAIQAVDDSFNVSHSMQGYPSFTSVGPYRLPYLFPVTNFLYRAEGARAAGAVAWGDFDHDGDLDLLMSGESWMMRLYVNNGNGSFTVHPQSFTNSNGSVEWGDVNGDGYLDFLVAGVFPDSGLVVYRNSGPPDFGFVPEKVGNSSFNDGHASFGDYDNDGDLDIAAITGEGRAMRTMIFRNDGPVTPDQPFGPRVFSSQQAWAGNRLLQLGTGANLAWCDFDHDGWLDLLVSGTVYGAGGDTYFVKLYRNLGPNPNMAVDWQFIEVQGLQLPQVNRATLAWGDADADGFPDLFMSGCRWDSTNNIEVMECALLINRPFSNDVGRTLVRASSLPEEFQVAALESNGVDMGQAVWGDINNDGRLDLVVASKLGNAVLGHASIFLNQLTNGVVAFVRHEPVSSGTYSGPAGEVMQGDLPVPDGSVSLALGDYDGDGRLDLLAPYTLPGGAGNTLQLYHNNYSVPDNLRPLKPSESSLQVHFDHDTHTLELGWAGTADNGPVSTLTPATGLTYNLSFSVVGQPGLVVAPNSESNGWRRLAAAGRWGAAGVDDFQWTLATFQPLLGSEYRFAVQAVDNGYMGSLFAETNFHFTTYINGTLNSQTAGGFQPLAGWTVFLDANGNNLQDVGELAMPTAVDGSFSFTVSTAGTYAVRQAPLPRCWDELARPDPLQIHITDAGLTFGGQNLLDQERSTLTGEMYFDRNKNGHRDPGEEGVDLWDTYLDANQNGQLDPGEASVRGGSIYEFPCLTPGPYAIGIVRTPNAFLPNGWQITEPAAVGGEHLVNANPGETLEANFGVWHAQYESSTIYGHLWIDEDSDGVIDANEPGRLSLWKVFLDDNNNGVLDGIEPNTISEIGGSYHFTNVRVGQRWIQVVPQQGWQQTFPVNGASRNLLVAGGSYLDQDFGFIQPGQPLACINRTRKNVGDGSFSCLLSDMYPWYRIDISDDLVIWETAAVICTTNGPAEFKDLDAAHLRQRFYRAVPQ